MPLEVTSHGPGPFLTHRIQRRPDGRFLVASSRRHRKGLAPHVVDREADASTPCPSHWTAFRHLVAPRRLTWWVAVLFIVGSAHFLVAALAGNWPEAFPPPLREARVVNWIFFIGSIFFTAAAYLQWLEAINGDVAHAFEPGQPRRFRWFGWQPRNLGYLAAAFQLVGTVLFNVNTADAMLAGLDWEREDILVWTPNMLGSVCFLVSSYIAFAEVSCGAFSFAPRSISWWIAVINLLASVAFQVSALYSVATRSPSAAGDVFATNSWTAAGAAGFLLGAYLMIPEMFDESPGADASHPLLPLI